MEQDLEKELRKAIGDLECPKAFKCCTEGLENISKVRDIGLGSYLECLEENAFACPFSVYFGDSYYCECPLRVYIAKKLKK